MQYTLQTLQNEAKRLGATVDYRHVGKWHVCNIDAPSGHVWNATGDTTTLVVEWRHGDPIHKQEAIEEGLSRIRDGTSLSV
jgi:hypothetical protein